MNPTLLVHTIRLQVSQLDRSREFYRRLGFLEVSGGTGRADFTAEPGGPVLLGLAADSRAAPPARDAAGLFHAALLFPHRRGLGAWLRQAIAGGIPFDGMADHGVSEALYLSDPDGNGLEFYADRPRESWPRDVAGLAMNTQALDWRGLIATAEVAGPCPLAGARWGHLHLRVTNLDRSERFYRERLGVVVTQRSIPGARFLASDGYHHHLALNSWGQPRTRREPGTLGLLAATMRVANLRESGEVLDPDGIPLRLEPMAAGSRPDSAP